MRLYNGGLRNDRDAEQLQFRNERIANNGKITVL
jgi:hypothetical protein